MPSDKNISTLSRAIARRLGLGLQPTEQSAAYGSLKSSVPVNDTNGADIAPIVQQELLNKYGR